MFDYGFLQALKDVKTGLRFNAKHLCSLIMHGALARPLVSTHPH